MEKHCPSFEDIKDLETTSQKNGSGISSEDLIGIWKLQSVWKKNSEKIDNISSSILQVLSATLQLKILDSKKNDFIFGIKNSLKVGLLSIVFCGKASLKGKRPLLLFYFETLKINIGNFSLINKSLEKTEKNKMPFFSLIAISKKDNWLCARGRGGGLAIWVKS